jgi:hypothetical protein
MQTNHLCKGHGASDAGFCESLQMPARPRWSYAAQSPDASDPFAAHAYLLDRMESQQTRV